jgi:hypothetical protein
MDHGLGAMVPTAVASVPRIRLGDYEIIREIARRDGRCLPGQEIVA